MGLLMVCREHVAQMGTFQNDSWGLGYIDLYLMHFPVALQYIEPSKLQYPVRTLSPKFPRYALTFVGLVDGRQPRDRIRSQSPNHGDLASNGETRR